MILAPNGSDAAGAFTQASPDESSENTPAARVHDLFAGDRELETGFAKACRYGFEPKRKLAVGSSVNFVSPGYAQCMRLGADRLVFFIRIATSSNQSQQVRCPWHMAKIDSAVCGQEVKA